MIQVIVTLIVIGVVYGLIETYVPMSPPIKTVLRIVIVLCLAIWLLQLFGLFHGGPDLFHAPRSRR